MAKQIKDNKKKILDIHNNLKKEIRSSYEILKKDYQNSLKEHNSENQIDFKKIKALLQSLFLITHMSRPFS